jgi:hypothetical protein
MIPRLSSRLIRAWVGDFDKPILAAKAVALMRPSVSRTDRIA